VSKRWKRVGKEGVRGYLSQNWFVRVGSYKLGQVPYASSSARLRSPPSPTHVFWQIFTKSFFRGPFLEGPGNFSGLESHSKISNITIHICPIWTEVPFIQEVVGVYTSPFLDTDELKMALRARKVSGAFEKRAPAPSCYCWISRKRFRPYFRHFVSMRRSTTSDT